MLKGILYASTALMAVGPAMAQSRLPPANTVPAPAAAVGYNVQMLGPAVMLGANWQPWGAGVNWTESVEWPSGRK